MGKNVAIVHKITLFQDTNYVIVCQHVELGGKDLEEEKEERRLLVIEVQVEEEWNK